MAQTTLEDRQQQAAASRNGDGLEVLETREWLDSLDYVSRHIATVVNHDRKSLESGEACNLSA